MPRNCYFPQISLGRILNIRLPSVRESLSKGILLVRVSHWDVVIIAYKIMLGWDISTEWNSPYTMNFKKWNILSNRISFLREILTNSKLILRIWPRLPIMLWKGIALSSSKIIHGKSWLGWNMSIPALRGKSRYSGNPLYRQRIKRLPGYNSQNISSNGTKCLVPMEPYSLVVLSF